MDAVTYVVDNIRHSLGTPGPNGFGSTSTAIDVARSNGARIKDKTFFITGCNTGIGYETALALCSEGGKVVMACRDSDKMREAANEIKKKVPNANITQLQLDIGSLDSVRKCAEKFKSLNLPLNVLINNAGIMMVPGALTSEGYERQFGTNVVGHFLLTSLLLPVLEKTGTKEDPARVVVLSSQAHRDSYSGGINFEKIQSLQGYSVMSSYGHSKLGNLLHAIELNKRLTDGGANVRVFAVHPGVVVTNLWQNVPGFLVAFARFLGRSFFKTPEQGAATSVAVATLPIQSLEPGRYYVDCNPHETYALAKFRAQSSKLYDTCREMLNITTPW